MAVSGWEILINENCGVQPTGLISDELEAQENESSQQANYTRTGKPTGNFLHFLTRSQSLASDLCCERSIDADRVIRVSPDNQRSFLDNVDDQLTTSSTTPKSSKRRIKTKYRLGTNSQVKQSIHASSSRSQENMRFQSLTVDLPVCEIGHSSYQHHHSDPLLKLRSNHSDTVLSRYSCKTDAGALGSVVKTLPNTTDDHTNFNLKTSKQSQAFNYDVYSASDKSKSDCGGKIQGVHKRSRTYDNEVMSMETECQTNRVADQCASNNTSSDDTNKPKTSFVNASPYCKQCGQRHRLSLNHEYNYTQEVDDDLHCDICLQPFVDPYDTKCGHTFCFICLKSYIHLKKMCPIDRKELTISSTNCWQSSLVMRKLVNKLIVRCPNETLCSLELPRDDLEAHLKERCPGTVLRCPKAIFGCPYKGPRDEQNSHIENCEFRDLEGNPISRIYPNCTKHTVELFRPEGISELGLSIVGGNDTPLRNIMVQTTTPYGLVAEDARICPGDIIIEVNGEDFHNISHVEARAVLSRSSRMMRFTLLRQNVTNLPDSSSVQLTPEIAATTKKIAVSLIKPPFNQLGIKISSYDDETPGIYILELIKGHVAHASGELRVGDRILEISHIDLWDGTPEIAAGIIQNSSERIDIIVSRRETSLPTTTIPDASLTNEEVNETDGSENVGSFESSLPSSLLLPPALPLSVSFSEKVIMVKKVPQESLGIVVSGGAGSTLGDLPVFVQNIQPRSVLGKDKRLSKGDLLIEVNGVRLNGLSHMEAISILKDVAQHSRQIALVAIELNYDEKEEDFALWEELSGIHRRSGRSVSPRDGSLPSAAWTPSWKMWLAVPPSCRITRDVVIKRSHQYGFGFSIIGGCNEKSINRVFIKDVSPNGPAQLTAGLKCGDEIVAVNARKVSTMMHCNVIQAMKNTTRSLLITIMSWPGSEH